jgi:hypothetical protein
MKDTKSVSVTLIGNYCKRYDNYDGWWVVGVDSSYWTDHRLGIAVITVTRLRSGYLSL